MTQLSTQLAWESDLDEDVDGRTADCPECGAPAYVEWSFALDSTDGPVEHLKVRCVNRHWYLLPSDHVDTS